MPISFTPQQRLDITRRQIRITQENNAFTNTAAQLTDQKATLLNVDNANDAFYQFYRVQSDSYEAERRAMDGNIPSMYTDGTISPFVAGDLSTSAQSPGSAGALFFPNSPIYTFFIPKIVAAVNGMLNPTGTDARYELDVMSNADVTNGLTQVLDFLLNGITGALPETATIVSPGFVGNNISISSEGDFSVGDYIFVRDTTGSSGLYKITAVNPFDIMFPLVPASLDVVSLFPAAVDPIIGGTVDNTVVGFTNAERIALTSVLYQEILESLTAKINSLVSEWNGYINNQIIQLGLQNDSRSTQAAQNAAAATNNNNAQVLLNFWLASPDIGPRTITSCTRTSNISTYNTSVPHGYTTNQTVVISGISNSSFNGTFTITNTAASSFTVSNPGINDAGGSGLAYVEPKYGDTNLTLIQNLETTRQSYISSRVSEIVAAVGNVVDNGDGTYGGVANSTYLNRYKWLNNRINRGTGSARRYFDVDSGIGFVNTMIASNNALQADYDAFFLTKAITQNDGEIIVFVTDVTGLAISDTVTIVSETQPEISRTITNIFANNQVELSSTIPVQYILDDIVRMFKTL